MTFDQIPPKENVKVSFAKNLLLPLENKKEHTISRRAEEVIHRRGIITPLKGSKKPDKIEKIPGFIQFFSQFSKPIPNRFILQGKEVSVQDLKDLNARRATLETQVSVSKRFEKLVLDNQEAVVELMKSKEVQNSIREAEKIFDCTVLDSVHTLAIFGDESIAVIDRVDDVNIKYEFIIFVNNIIHEATQAIRNYERRRETLFLSGLFSVYKNALKIFNDTPRKVQLTNLKTPGTLDMIKTVGGSVKIITDSLIPSFVELIHQKIVTPPLVEEKGLLSPRNQEIEEENKRKLKKKHQSLSEEEADYISFCYTRLVENYRSRGDAKNQMEYFENLKQLQLALDLID